MPNNPKSTFSYKINKVKLILKALSCIDGLIFKGGTALSLTYGKIKRFSEDIDLSFDIKKVKNKSGYANKVLEMIKVLEAEVKSWKEKGASIIFDDDKKDIKINFQNKGEITKNDSVIKPDTILIEPPNQFRKVEYDFESIPPFKNAKFKMNVMTLKNIHFDKTLLIFEKFMENQDFNWAIGEIRNNSRHLYDFQTLCSEEFILEKEKIKKRLMNNVFKASDNKIIFRKKYKTSTCLELSNENAWSKFKIEFKSSKNEISNSIASVVYPNTERFKTRIFIKKYKNYYKVIFKIAKNIYKMNK